MQSGSVRGGVVKLGDVGRGQRWVKEGRDVERGSREEVEKNCKEEYGKGMQRVREGVSEGGQSYGGRGDGLMTGEEKVIWVGCLVVGGETSGMYTAER